MRLWTPAASPVSGDFDTRRLTFPPGSRRGQEDVRVGGPAPEWPLLGPIPRPDGRRHTKIFDAKADAWAWLATQQIDLLRKSWRAPNASRRTVGEYAEDYLARNDLRESTRVLYAGLWRHHLAEPWAHVPVDEVTPPSAPGTPRPAE